jgi:hypothetical protein
VGKLVDLLKAVFAAAAAIRIQRHPKSLLAGKNYRSLLEKQDEILRRIGAGIGAAGYSPVEVRGFVERRARVLKPLRLVSRRTRRTEGGGGWGVAL